MGCFFLCFKGSNGRRRCRKHKKSSPVKYGGFVFLLPRAITQEKESCAYFRSISSGIEIIAETAAAAVNPFPKLSENEEQGTVSNIRKKVTFDLHVTTFEIVPFHEDSKDFTEDGEIVREAKEGKKDKEEEECNHESKIAAACPPNHRYQNCDSSDDEGLDEEDEASDDDEENEFDEGDDISINGDEEESYDSYFSLHMEGESKHFHDVTKPNHTTTESNTDVELPFSSKASVRDRSRYINSVLNPVENISHWKELKVRPTSKNPSNKKFEPNTRSFISPEPTFSEAERPHKSFSSNPNPDDFGKQEIALDASLSNWLVSPNNSKPEPQRSNSMLSNSSISQEERPILGALTIEDIKHSSRTSSPRKSPSWSAEEVPIVGTVGGYWSSKSGEESSSSWSSISEERGIPNTTGKYREDKRVNLYFTPFETRLERALNSETRSNVEYTA
ncbi:uncharacterized protein LOC110027684 [Phalaenopsis equestris]|uniref:uncharacterized protein LOC110027684 n=1 Tax=Phalaenopsis equestris TaxID=78828 RepID=UPI0009E6560C|nr:uncharacterized protein LOC110027684 [Phalaenopsis equestris]